MWWRKEGRWSLVGRCLFWEQVCFIRPLVAAWELSPINGEMLDDYMTVTKLVLGHWASSDLQMLGPLHVFQSKFAERGYILIAEGRYDRLRDEAQTAKGFFWVNENIATLVASDQRKQRSAQWRMTGWLRLDDLSLKSRFVAGFYHYLWNPHALFDNTDTTNLQ